MKRALMPIAILALLAALPACSSSDDSSATESPGSATTSSAAPTPSATPAEAEPVGPVDGYWHAGPFPLARVSKALDAAALGEYFPELDVFTTQDPEADVVYDLKIQDDSLLMTVTFDGRTLGVIDRQSVAVHGQQVAFSTSGCTSTFRWTRKADRLTLSLVKDACPDFHGTPDAAYATALYASVPFERV